MGPKEAENVLKVLGAMGDLELAMADFYDACGKAWTEDRPLWSSLSAAELRHGEHIVKIAKRLSKNPKVFEINRPISITAIQTVVQGIKSNILKVEKGELTRKQVFLLARDMEMSILESKYKEMLKTEDAQYKAMMSEITAQTDSHHQLIVNRIESLKGNPQEA